MTNEWAWNILDFIVGEIDAPHPNRSFADDAKTTAGNMTNPTTNTNAARKRLVNLFREIDRFEDGNRSLHRQLRLTQNMASRPAHLREEAAAMYDQVRLYETALYHAMKQAVCSGVRASTIRAYIDRYDGVYARQCYVNSIEPWLAVS